MAKYDYGYASSRALAAGGIEEAGQQCDKVWVVTSDIGGAMRNFRKQCPGRYVDTGIAEQAAAGIAAGLAIEGYKPYILGMLPFLSMRDLEQVRTDICYQNLPVTIIGTGGGLVSGGGSTHNCMEDVSLMRTLANMSVVSTSDPHMAPMFVKAALDWDGPLYIRQAGGKSDRIIYEPGSYTIEIGKGMVAREGSDVLIFAHGGSVVDALDAAEAAQKKGISVKVVDMYSIKPLDEELILKSVSEINKVIVVEDHLLRGGLSSAISELLMDKGVYPAKFRRLGIPDIYAGFGSGIELREKYGYGPTGIGKVVEEFMA